MLKDDLWELVVGDRYAGIICIHCFEHRVGRKLCKEDFTPGILINDLTWAPSDRSEKLINRMS